MPPKRLTDLPANVFLDHIAPKLKTRNTARLNIATGGQIPGLVTQARKLNAQRKQAALAIIKRQQHALARRIVTVMKGIRMFLRKENSTNPKNKAWMQRYAHNGYVFQDNGSVMKTFKFRSFGGLEIEVKYDFSWYQTWLLKIYGNTSSKYDRWVYYADMNMKDGNRKVGYNSNNANNNNILANPVLNHRSHEYASVNVGEFINNIQSTPEIESHQAQKRVIWALMTPVHKEVISMWNALPKAERSLL
jgi:hypothetical protein